MFEERGMLGGEVVWNKYRILFVFFQIVIRKRDCRINFAHFGAKVNSVIEEELGMLSAGCRLKQLCI